MKLQSFRVYLLTIVFLSLVQIVPSDSEAQEVTRWSLKYMARASSLLMAAHEQSLNKEPNVCRLSSEDVTKMTDSLKKLTEERIKLMSSSEKDQVMKDLRSCDQDCTCDGYFRFLESQSDAKFKSAISNLESTALRVGMKERARCAKAFVEFCQSNLAKVLRK